MSSDDLDLETAHGHLDAFLVDNEELEALSAKSAEEHGFKVRAEAFSEGVKLTRLITETHKLRKDEYGEPEQNVDYIEALARKLWATFQPKIQTMVDVVKAARLEP